MQKELEKAGLSKNEAKIYLILLETGLTSTKNIIKKSNLHRQTVYDTLNSLKEKGLASSIIESKKTKFKATHPKIFLQNFEKQKAEIESKESEFQKVLPMLEKINKQDSKPEATTYWGNQGIVSLLNDMLNQKQEILTIAASDINAKSLKYHLEFNLPKFHKTREAKKIKQKIIFSEDMKKRASLLNKKKNTQAKTLSKEFTSSSSTNIYGNKVSIILWGSQPFGILIKNEDIAKTQKKYFNILWKKAIPQNS